MSGSRPKSNLQLNLLTIQPFKSVMGFMSVVKEQQIRMIAYRTSIKRLEVAKYRLRACICNSECKVSRVLKWVSSKNQNQGYL